MKQHFSPIWRPVAVLALALVMATTASAQQHGNHDRQFDYTVMMGLNMCQIDGDASGGYNKMGLHGAVNTSFPLGDNDAWRLQVEVGISQKGSYSKSIDRTISLLYIEVPVMLTYNTADSRLRLGVGVAPAVLGSARVDDSGVYNELQSDNYRRVDALPLCVSARYQVIGGLAIEARFYNSMLTCAKESSSGTYRLFRSNMGQFNRLLTVGVAYCF